MPRKGGFSFSGGPGSVPAGAKRVKTKDPGGPQFIRPDAALFAPLAAQLLSEGLSITFRARGRSMRPFIHDGDTVTVSPVERHPVALGSVVLHIAGEHGDTVHAHRVVARERTGGGFLYKTRGDAFWLHTDSVTEGHVLGVVTECRRGDRSRALQRFTPRMGALLRSWLRAARTRVLLRISKG